MADISLKKFLPDDMCIFIQKLVHKERLKKVHKEFYEIIYKTFKSGSIKLSGDISYMTTMRYNINIYLGTSTITFLTNLMWYEFWCEFSKLKKTPKRNLSPMLSYKMSNTLINQKTPFKVCKKKWLT